MAIEWIGIMVSTLMAGVTAWMALETRKMAREAKRSVDEPRRYEARSAFLSFFIALRRDIVQYDTLNRRLVYGDMMVLDFSPNQREVTQKSLGQLTAISFSAFQKMDYLLGKLLLPREFLKRVWGIESEINYTLKKIDEILRSVIASFDGGVVNVIINNVNAIRLYQRQLACYFIVQADNEGYGDIAHTMRELPEFAPDSFMQLKKEGDLWVESSGAQELDGCFAACKIDNLVKEARQIGGNQKWNPT